MKTNLVALLAGIIFGLGLAVSQMMNPNKVLNFLDITGNWDSSLAFVMMGALGVCILSFRLILKRPTPFFDDAFHVSHKITIDKPLVIGSAVFGIGWGMTGYCPGPAVASLGLFSVEAVIMVVSIYVGFFSHRFLIKK
ncbi:GENE II AND X PROTEINS [Bathymodiolus brooksi thiotrophic gill symbiont]|nr:GENE II AND X PROTEINS [Bathymodiolus brooksi thiotrophic gill symbiont]CAB9544622.1 GENE II AND X PROTEINS [Bathymodiolus brooksi thiotrophic gill symbiont]SHE20834.1 GENE II AND X PROTEINS [Bathymodiolus brooksi thiotrophic gill symbiont]